MQKTKISEEFLDFRCISEISIIHSFTVLFFLRCFLSKDTTGRNEINK